MSVVSLIYISQSSVAMRLRCGWIFNDCLLHV